MNGQLVLAAIPQALADRMDLLQAAFEDAAAWREEMGDEETAEAYQQLAAQMEAVT